MSSLSAPMVVIHQCMDKEWVAWGRDSAKEMAARGLPLLINFDKNRRQHRHLNYATLCNVMFNIWSGTSCDTQVKC